jgi:hypothetical protein
MKPRNARLSLALALSILVVPSVSAVSLSENGTGQALILPYYTVNGGNSTLLSLRNSTAAVKAVRITFREGRNGAEVLSFNIYLAPFDTWTGAVTGETEGPARISSSDKSCTVPTLPPAGQPFHNFEYALNVAEGGPFHLERTREGMVELIEMGELFDDADGSFRPAAAATPTQTQIPGNETAPSNCGTLESAWIAGRWSVQPHRNLRSPTGGLSANAVIVNVAQGSSFSVPALAFDGFFQAALHCAPACAGVATENLHSAPGAYKPDLGSARDASGGATAVFRHLGQNYRMQFEGSEAGARAVTALLMRRSLSNEFNSSQAALLRAESEWVLSQPTRYLLQASNATPVRKPFLARYRGSNSAPFTDLEGACEETRVSYFGRDGRGPSSGILLPLPPPSPPGPRLCWATQVFTFNQDGVGEVLRGGQASRVLGARFATNIRTCQQLISTQAPSCPEAGPPFDAGSVQVSFPDDRNFLHAAAEPLAHNPGSANLLTGLPVIGFWVSNFSATGSPGVLANFAVQQAHSGVISPHAGTVSLGGASWTPQP